MQGTYLITGGEGFIGRSTKQYLQKNNCNALTLYIDSKPDYMMSVTDFHSLAGIEEKLDGIFHLAATISPPQFEDDPLGGFQVNANGTLNVLEFAKRKKIRRVVLDVHLHPQHTAILKVYPGRRSFLRSIQASTP